MKRSILLGFIFLFSSLTIFAQRQISDDDRKYWDLNSKLFPIPLEDIYVQGARGAAARITYIGKNCMQQIYNDYVRVIQKHSYLYMVTNLKLVRKEEYVINMLLERYNTSRGDTFTICVNIYDGIRGYPIFMILEFTSNTQYSYYVWEEHIRE
jgi:hypothetical protein